MARLRRTNCNLRHTAEPFWHCRITTLIELDCGQKWLARITPFFTAREREHAGCQHRLFFSQVEYCDNLIFRRRAALDNLGQRLLDTNRTIGQPHKFTVIFGRKITKTLSGQAADRDRGHESPQSRVSQPLRQRLYQAIRSRPPHPPDRIGKQRRQRLRRQQSGGNPFERPAPKSHRRLRLFGVSRRTPKHEKTHHESVSIDARSASVHPNE